MTALVGNDGSVSIATHGGILNRWTANFSRVVSNVTPFGQSNKTAHRGGLWGISGTISGVPDSTSTPAFDSLDADGVSITLTCGTSRSLAFTGIVSSTGVDVDVNGGQALVFDFIGGDTDAITETWTG